MKVVFLRSFLKDIKKIKDPKIARKIEQLLIDLQQVDSLDEIKDIKKMSGYSIAYRIKIGNYRLGMFKENGQVELARFLKREDIYKVFP
ncbi:MAG: plasmid stabilization protein [Flavobacteriales bacterium]|nr:plasmid stabilization protein [Flavobacteriales bacterium]